MELVKLENGSLVYPPKRIHEFVDDREIFITNPTDEQLIERGFKPLSIGHEPKLKGNEYLIPNYTENENEIICNYEIGVCEED